MLIFAFALAVAPQPVAIESDLHCMVAIAAAVDQASAEQKPGLIDGIWYFFGRIDAAAPKIDLQGEMARIAAAADAPALTADLARCGKILQDRQTYLAGPAAPAPQAPPAK